MKKIKFIIFLFLLIFTLSCKSSNKKKEDLQLDQRFFGKWNFIEYVNRKGAKRDIRNKKKFLEFKTTGDFVSSDEKGTWEVIKNKLILRIRTKSNPKSAKITQIDKKLLILIDDTTKIKLIFEKNQ